MTVVGIEFLQDRLYSVPKWIQAESVAAHASKAEHPQVPAQHEEAEYHQMSMLRRVGIVILRKFEAADAEQFLALDELRGIRGRTAGRHSARQD